MNTVVVNIKNHVNKIPNLYEILQKEMERALDMKDQGLIQSFFIKINGKGAIIVYIDVTLDEAKELTASFPMYKYFKKVSYIETEQSI